jgi:hypothetical protein
MTNQVTFPPAVGGDGSTVTDDSNATTGLANGGFRTRLLPMFTQIINIALNILSSANNAATSATSAAASAATALNAPGTAATSTTSLTLGLGNQTFTVQTGKLFAVGQFVTISQTAAPTNLMYGVVTAYNSSTGSMTVNVLQFAGSGTAAAWSIALSGGQGQSQKLTNVNATVTASATLAAMYLYVPVAMTTFGQAVTLPAANTLATGGPQYIFDNSKGAYPFGIRDNAGTLLMGVAPGGVASVSLKDNSSVAGVWSVEGTNLEPGLVTIDTTLSTTYAGSGDGTTGAYLALNSNQSLHFSSNAAKTGFYAYIVDNVGKQVTTPVLVASGLTANCKVGAVYAVTATTAIVFYGDGSNNTYAVVLTVSGTAISVGTPAVIAYAAAGLTFQEDGYSAPRIAQLSPTLYVVGGSNSGATGWTAVAAFSVSGTTVTAGAVASIATSYGMSSTVYALTATTALVIYTTGSAAPYSMSAVVVSVSGTTCTVGAAAGISISYGMVRTGPPFSCLLSPTAALVVGDGAGSSVYPFVCTINGTSVSFSSPSLLEAVSPFSNHAGYTDDGGSRFAPHLLALSSTTAFLWYIDNVGYSRSLVLTINGSTWSAGPIVYDAISANGVGLGFVLPYGTTEFVSVKQVSTGGGPYLGPCKISGSSITGGYGKVLSDFSPLSPGVFFCNRLSGGDYVLYASGTPLMAVFRSNGDAINLRGSISMPPLMPTVPNNTYFQLGAVASNRMVLAGGTAKSAGPSANIGQARILSVEIAA